MQTLNPKKLGKFTASEIWKLFTGGATRSKYIFEKAEEIVKGHPKLFSNKNTEHGHFFEHEAITSFTEATGILAENLMQEYFPINEDCGSTPDAQIIYFSGNAIASCDVKCPTNTFFEQKMLMIDYKKPEFQNVPKEYFYQGQMQMMSLNVKEHYLVRYLAKSDVDNDGNQVEYDLPLNVRLFYKIIKADERVQAQILGLVAEAVKERDLLVSIFKKSII